MTRSEFEKIVAEAAARIRRTAFPAPTCAEEREHAVHTQHAEYGGSAH